MKSTVRLSLISAAAFIFGTSAGPAVSQNVANESPATAGQGAVLWRDFRFGMSPEDFVSRVSSLPEVKSAKVKTSKGDEPKIDINYNGGGVKIYDQIFQILPVFSSGRLEFIVLRTRASCLTYKVGDHRKIFDALGEKFPRKIYSSDQVVISSQAPVKSMFTDGRTRVQLNLSVSELPELPKVPRKQYENTTDWNYEFAKANYERVVKTRQDRLYECPNSDGGAYADIGILYADEADQARKVLERQQQNDAKRQQDEARSQNEAGKL